MMARRLPLKPVWESLGGTPLLREVWDSLETSPSAPKPIPTPSIWMQESGSPGRNAWGGEIPVDRIPRWIPMGGTIGALSTGQVSGLRVLAITVVHPSGEGEICFLGGGHRRLSTGHVPSFHPVTEVVSDEHLFLCGGQGHLLVIAKPSLRAATIPLEGTPLTPARLPTGEWLIVLGDGRVALWDERGKGLSYLDLRASGRLAPLWVEPREVAVLDGSEGPVLLHPQTATWETILVPTPTTAIAWYSGFLVTGHGDGVIHLYSLSHSLRDPVASGPSWPWAVSSIAGAMGTIAVTYSDGTLAGFNLRETGSPHPELTRRPMLRSSSGKVGRPWVTAAGTVGALEPEGDLLLIPSSGFARRIPMFASPTAAPLLLGQDLAIPQSGGIQLLSVPYEQP